MKKQFINIGLLVSKARKESGLSARKFIILCDLGISNQFLSEVEKGRASMPIKKQIQIARAMDIDRIEFQGASVNDFIDNYNRVEM